jgi:ubiquinone/menaquinone biosynthesis C-methylase UbiE
VISTALRKKRPTDQEMSPNSVRDAGNSIQIDSRQETYESLVSRHFRSTLDYWEQIYSDRTVYSRIYQERAARAIGYLDHIGISTGAPVLEVGCGPGVISVEMARKGFTVSAVDCVQEMAERTKAISQRLGLSSKIFTHAAKIDNLPFPDDYFELAMVIGVSEWLVSMARALQEVSRVLRPGGYLIISADNNWPLHQILDPLINPALKPIKTGVGKILRSMGLRTFQPRFQAYSCKAFDDVLVESGFDKVESQTLGFGPFTLCNRKLFNDEVGWQLHRELQSLADKGVPLLRSAGLVYLVLAQKSCVRI